MSIGNRPQFGQELVDGEFIRGIVSGQNWDSSNGITAHAGGGQASATQLPVQYSVEVQTVATADDSVKLPLATKGESIIVTNSSAASMNLYASDTPNQKNAAALDKINGSSNATAYAIAAGVTVMFICSRDGFWFALKSA